MTYLRKHSKIIGTPPQSMPLDRDQVPNSAGGHSYQVDKWQQLERFLVLGSEGGSYYASEQKLTFENVASLEACVRENGLKTVEIIRGLSQSGRAPKNEPALFALAFCISHGDQLTRQHAADVLSDVARTGTHLFHFAQMAQDMRGWGRVLKNAIGQWYGQMAVERLVDQLIKYRQRDGWTHADLLRLSHPRMAEDKQALVQWSLRGQTDLKLPERLQGHVELQATSDAHTAVGLIERHRLTWESVPTELLKDSRVWGALLPHMPITALIRNLGRMSANGLLKPLSAQSKFVASQLTNEALLKKGRVHPLTLLNALRTYQQGHGDKGSLSWTPVAQVVEALDDAFYMAFQSIEPTQKNFFLGLDISGSMSWSKIAGMSITPREASTVMAMVTARRERNYHIKAFNTTMVDVPVTSKSSLADALRITDGLPWGGTDCSQPMLDALRNKLEVDCFVVYTDSETWAGKVHPKQALDMYRQKMGRGARLVVVGMVANKFSIADPKDQGMLDVVGFDTVTPQLISQFAL